MTNASTTNNGGSTDKQWDYIIIGAGSAGCALTNELVRTGKKILLIESGGSDLSAYIKFPVGVWSMPSKHDWGYRSQPDPTKNGMTEEWKRGRVLGGCSSINGMVYTHGAAQDYDRWARQCQNLGGWSANEVLPILRDLESSDQRSPVRGQTGPLHVRTIRRPHPITDAYIAAARAAGHAFNPDCNGPIQEGVGYLQATQWRGLRWNAASAFLRPHLAKKNLTLLTHATVEKIEISNGRAVAVILRHRNRVRRETARGIVLSAGTINSPKLLMLSGIGDAQELRRHGIVVHLDLPAVGRNLKEHPRVTVAFRSTKPTYNLTEGLWQKIGIAANYLFHREGPLAIAYESMGFLKTTPAAPGPELQLFFSPIGFWRNKEGKMTLGSMRGFKIVVIRSHAQNDGRVRLASADPAAAPLIEFRLLNSQNDVDMLARGIDMVREIAKQEPLTSLIDAEIEPGPTVNSVQAMHDYVRGDVATTCHPNGTCRMGVGANTVVGPDLRVHGMENLWIADASIMPDAPSANLNAPCMMIGAKLGRQLAARR